MSLERKAGIAGIFACVSILFVGIMVMATGQNKPSTSTGKWGSQVLPMRSVVRAQNGMVASSQPLASLTGIDILKRGGNAVDAAIAMAAVLNVTEPMMTGIGGDMFAIVHWAATGELKGLNASGRAPHALNLAYFEKKGIKTMPLRGMASVTVPGAFDGWIALLEKYGTMKLADLLAPAIQYADNGYPVMEKAAADWTPSVEVLKLDPAAALNYLTDGRAPRPGEIFRQRNLARTFRILAQGGRDAFYKGPIGQAIVAYCQTHGGFLTLQDLAENHPEWVKPISTNYRGFTVYELPPNGQGLTVLETLNILEGFDLASMAANPVLYEHTLIEATKLAFADRDRYISDPEFTPVPVKQLLSKEYASERRALIHPNKVIESPSPGIILNNGDTVYFTVVDKDRNAVSFINSLFQEFGSGVVAGDTGIVLQDRGSGFSLDPKSPNRYEPAKRPFHTLIPAMVFKDGEFFMSFGVMGGAMQPQGHVQVLSNLIDLGMGVQQAVEAPRFRFYGGKDIILEDGMTQPVIGRLIALGHHRVFLPNAEASMGGAQLIAIDPVNGSLMGASDSRKDGMALGY
jgi:gamma-glutamyltranspeptidase / glutathione hydrolase